VASLEWSLGGIQWYPNKWQAGEVGDEIPARQLDGEKNSLAHSRRGKRENKRKVR
jgi:hypothetical protein